MNRHYIYTLVDHNHQPPRTTYYDTRTDHHNALDQMLSATADPAKIEISVSVYQAREPAAIYRFRCV